MNGLMNFSTRACGGQLSGKQYCLVFLAGYGLFILLAVLHLGVGADMPRNGTSHIIRLLWGGFGLIAGSGLVLVAIGLGLGVFRLSNNFTQTKRRLIKSLVVLHGLVVIYASGLLLIWLTILTLQL